ncbi:MAG: 3,4-dihydroxy-2-butanone-4-phosphate synthase [Verrucomicrobiae bacterium]|nr:3,4-dihydroxy-2-butanone-4-phosphate synthase [Verrucomicrobiae bacterium]
MKKKTSRRGAASPIFDSIESVIDDIRRGRMVIVVDDPNRENEGDLLMAAAKVSPAHINFMTQHGRGLICLPATAERLRQMGIGRMVVENRESQKTAFMVSIDASKGVTTGISAHDRARAARILADPKACPGDLVQPGHVFPLQARPGGVLNRAGHTETAVDLARIAGLPPVGVICEIMNPDGSMARLPQLLRFRRRHRLKLCTVRDLIAYRRLREKLVERIKETDLPTPHGVFKLFVYRSVCDGLEHLALVHGNPCGQRQPALVRVQAENVTADALGSGRFGRPDLVQDSLKRIVRAGHGVLLYMRHPGWGPVSGEPSRKHEIPHLREYGLGAQMLVDLGIRKIKLLVSHSKTVVGLEGYGLEIVREVRL